MEQRPLNALGLALRPDQFARYNRYGALTPPSDWEESDYLLVTEISDGAAVAASTVTLCALSDPDPKGRFAGMIQQFSQTVSGRLWADCRGLTEKGSEPGRNEACPCGSQIKYKRCHGPVPVPKLVRQHWFMVRYDAWRGFLDFVDEEFADYLRSLPGLPIEEYRLVGIAFAPHGQTIARICAAVPSFVSPWQVLATEAGPSLSEVVAADAPAYRNAPLLETVTQFPHAWAQQWLAQAQAPETEVQRSQA